MGDRADDEKDGDRLRGRAAGAEEEATHSKGVQRDDEAMGRGKRKMEQGEREGKGLLQALLIKSEINDKCIIHIFNS